MPYYKGTLQQCQEYNSDVISGENYDSTTTNWAEPIEINGDWYIMKAEPPMATVEYSSTLEEVAELPEAQSN